MIDRETAEKNARERLKEIPTEDADEILIIRELTIEKEYGWIFFYESKIHLETGNYRYSLVGGGPLLIEKSDGSFHYLGTRLDVDDAIKEYEKKNQ